jgi:hypothetical protein
VKKPVAKSEIDATVQRRLDALERLIDAEYQRSVSAFEQRTAIKMAQVNQWFTGYRALRDKALRRLEARTKKPEGWFDRPPVPGELGASGIAGTLANTVPSLTLAATLERLAQLLLPIPRERRREAGRLLEAFALAPDSALLQVQLIDAIEQSVDAQKPLGAAIAPDRVDELTEKSRAAEQQHEEQQKPRKQRPSVARR